MAQGLEIRNSLRALHCFCDSRQRRDMGCLDLAGKWERREGGINLEGQRPVGPIQEVPIGANTGKGMFGGIVVGPSGLDARFGMLLIDFMIEPKDRECESRNKPRNINVKSARSRGGGA